MQIVVRARNFLQRRLVALQRWYFINIWGMTIGEGTKISLSTKLDKTNPKGIHIGSYSYITFGSAILAHDMSRRIHRPVSIGDYCFIGCHTVVMPGVTIGDHCVIGANSVVTSDIPPNCIAAGNPAKVIKRDIETDKWGILIKKTEEETR